jgi:hypothetical protein
MVLWVPSAHKIDNLIIYNLIIGVPSVRKAVSIRIYNLLKFLLKSVLSSRFCVRFVYLKSTVQRDS